jgi:hypothetical protein
MPTRQYTIRAIPAEVDEALRKKAKAKGVSLNRLLLDELIAATGVTQARRRSIEPLLAKWQDDPAFDAALEEQRRIDWDSWR